MPKGIVIDYKCPRCPFRCTTTHYGFVSPQACRRCGTVLVKDVPGDEVRELTQDELQMMRDIAGPPSPPPPGIESMGAFNYIQKFMREIGVPPLTEYQRAMVKAMTEHAVTGRIIEYNAGLKPTFISEEAGAFIDQRRRENPGLSIYTDDQLSLMYEAQVVLRSFGLGDEVESYLQILSATDGDRGERHPILGVLGNLAADIQELRQRSDIDELAEREDEPLHLFADEEVHELLVSPPEGYGYDALMQAARCEFPGIVERMREIDNAGWLRCFRRWHTKHPGPWYTVQIEDDGTMTFNPPVTAAEVNEQMDLLAASLDSLSPRG